MRRKHCLRLNDEELNYLTNVLTHFCDFMHDDERPDHGLARLREWQVMPAEAKQLVSVLSGRVHRMRFYDCDSKEETKKVQPFGGSLLGCKKEALR